MTVTISPEKLALFERTPLKGGSHGSTFKGEACAMEWVSFLADEGFTDAPQCASLVLRRYTITLNDRWNDEKRQTLKPYLLRMIGTGNDGKDPIRNLIAAKYVANLMGPWLRLAGLNDEANRIEATTDLGELRRLLWAARDAAWNIRAAKRDELRAKIEPIIRGKLAKAADAVADADAAAAAAAVAAAVADAAAVAVAAAAAASAVADAAADAPADAPADAVAVAVAAAVAAAVADADADAAAAAVAVADAAVAVAVAVAAAPTDTWGTSYSAAYKAARAYYEANPLPIAQEIAEIISAQDGAALDLLDKLIDASEVSA